MLLLARQGNTLTADKLLSFAEANEQVWALGAEITDQAILADASRILGAALECAYQANTQATGTAHRSFEMTLRQLV